MTPQCLRIDCGAFPMKFRTKSVVGGVIVGYGIVHVLGHEWTQPDNILDFPAAVLQIQSTAITSTTTMYARFTVVNSIIGSEYHVAPKDRDIAAQST
jgi:hypothetical protein